MDDHDHDDHKHEFKFELDVFNFNVMLDDNKFLFEFLLNTIHTIDDIKLILHVFDSLDAIVHVKFLLDSKHSKHAINDVKLDELVLHALNDVLHRELNFDSIIEFDFKLHHDDITTVIIKKSSTMKGRGDSPALLSSLPFCVQLMCKK